LIFGGVARCSSMRAAVKTRNYNILTLRDLTSLCRESEEEVIDRLGIVTPRSQGVLIYVTVP